MAYTPLPTVVLGDLWTAANHNTFIRDNFSELWKIQAAEDLIVGASASTAKRLAVGADDTLLGVVAGELAYQTPQEFGLPEMVLYALKTSALSVATSTYTTITNWATPIVSRNGVSMDTATGIITLPIGKYIMRLAVEFDTHATGVRECAFVSAGGFGPYRAVLSAQATAPCLVAGNFYYNRTAAGTGYASSWQNSGGNLNVSSATLEIIRIAD
jgi:hypothetical protein